MSELFLNIFAFIYLFSVILSLLKTFFNTLSGQIWEDVSCLCFASFVPLMNTYMAIWAIIEFCQHIRKEI